jgi:oligopeptide transport system ATP-binding protein
MTDVLLRLEELCVRFPVRRGVLQRTVGWVRAVDGIDLSIAAGETVALVGESGCGKSTTGLASMGILPAASGRVLINGKDLTSLRGDKLRSARRRMQMVFQDPTASLNSRMTVGQLVSEPLIVHQLTERDGQRERVTALLETVGLGVDAIERFPHEFSGGQRQRIAIARALASEPDILICDEAIASLDVSVRAQVINLLARLQGELGLSYLFISHDLAAVRHLAHRVLVMYLGKMMELTDNETLYSSPAHPYTKALLSAVPIPDPDLELARKPMLLVGEVPSPVNPPSGCVFRTRCPMAQAVCAEQVPEWRDIGGGIDGHWVACHFAEASPAVGAQAPLDAEPSDVG